MDCPQRRQTFNRQVTEHLGMVAFAAAGGAAEPCHAQKVIDE